MKCVKFYFKIIIVVCLLFFLVFGCGRLFVVLELSLRV